jgi:diguanylate cyclase (GGDEF)-like protein/PAS domain S-box-containing protein
MHDPATKTTQDEAHLTDGTSATRLTRIVIATCAVLLAALWGLIANDLRHEREIHVAQAQRDNENLGIAFQYHVESTLASIDGLLLSLRHDVEGGADPSKHSDLIDWVHRGPLKDSIVQIGIIDRNGYLIYSSANAAGKPIHVGDRDHFRAHLDGSRDVLYVSKSIHARTSDLQVIPFSRRINGPDGRFLGVVSVLVRTEHFSNFYHSIRLGGQSAVTLVRNGLVLARASAQAPPNDPIGIDASSVLPGPEVAIENRVILSPVDGLTRLIHYRRVKDQPLAVIVSQTEQDYLAEYRDTFVVQLIIGLTASLAIIGLALMLARLARRLEAARQKTAASESRLRSIVENINVATWEFDIATERFSYVSPQIETMFGYPAADWIQEGFWHRHLHDADREWAVAFCDGQTGRCADHEFAYRFIKQDGSVAWVRDIVKVLTDGKGKPIRLTGVFIDFTAPKEAAIALAHQQALLRSLIDSVPDLIFFKDTDSTYLGCNKAFAAFAGRPESEQIGKSDFDFFDQETAEFFRLNDREMLAQGQTRRNEEWVRYPDGREVLFDTVKAPFLDSQGETLGLIGISRDITETYRAEESLMLAKSVFETTTEGIVVTDTDTRILLVNPAFTAITGWSAAEAIGQTPSMLKSGRYPPEFYADMWQSIREKGHWEGEIWNRRKNGEIYVQWISINAIGDNRGKGTRYVALFSDITQRKTREEEVWRQANFDALTGLANRNLFHDRLDRALARARRNQESISLMFIDLDHFKWVNDTHGHRAGDNLLIEAAARLQGCVREEDTVARLGGDEFTVVLEGHAGRDAMQTVAEKILAALTTPFDVGGIQVRISCSVGVTTFPQDGDDTHVLLHNADLAMYQAKAAGRNRCHFYSPDSEHAPRPAVATAD